MQRELDQLTRPESTFPEPRLVLLRRKQLLPEGGANEPYDALVFADIRERRVGTGYCEGGFGATGSPCGLIFFYDNSFGMDRGWYRGLTELVRDT